MTTPSQSQQEIVEQLVAACLERLPAEGEAVVEAVCRDHPEHAATVRRLLRSLGTVGLIDESADDSAGVPDEIAGYRLLERLGAGGMGEVYLAEQQRPRRRVALKLLRPGHLAFSRSRERFRREADAVARLDHPGICPLFDAGEDDGVPYLAMQFVDGDTLAQRIERARETARHRGAGKIERATDTGARDAVQTTVLLIEKVARALHYAHEKGLVHRDVKPGNVMVTPDGEPVLLDFGLALTANADVAALTRTGDQLGTPAYMSPEQVMGGRDIDRRADVYGLGATLYEALTLRCPHNAPTRDALYRQILGGSEVARPTVHNRTVSRDLEIVIATALDREPDRRYATAQAFADDLRRVREHQPIAARPAGRLLRLRRWAQRRPGVASALLVTFLLLAGGLVAALFALDALERENRTARALGLAGAAQDEVRSDPTRASLLGLAAVELEDRLETRSALHRALATNHERSVFRTAGKLTFATANADGSRFLTGSLTGDVQLFDRAGRELWRGTLRGPSDQPQQVNLLQFVGPDRFLAGTRTGEVRLYDGRGQELDGYRATRALRGSPQGAEPPPETPIVLRHEGALQLLTITGPDRDRLELQQELEHEGIVRTVAFDPTGRWLATAARGVSRGKLWRRQENGRYEAAGPVLAAPAHIVSLDLSATHAFVGVWNGPNVRFDLRSGERSTIAVAGESVTPLDNGGAVVTAIGDRVRLVDESGVVTEPKQPRFLLPNMAPAIASPDGRRFAACYQNGTMIVFDSSGRQQATLLGHTNQVRQARFLNGGRELFSWSSLGTARLWTLTDAELERRFERGVALLSESPTGQRLVRSGGQKLLVDADWRNRQPLIRGGNVWAAPTHAFDSAGTRVALVRGAELLVFDTRTGAGGPVHEDPVHEHGAYCWLPGSDEVLRFSGEGRPRGGSVVDVETGAETAFPAGVRPIWCVAPWSDGDAVAVAYGNGTVVRFERSPSGWQPGNQLQIGSGVRVMAFSPTGDRLLLGTDDGRLLACDRTLTRPGATFFGHRLSITDVRYSHDGRLVASTSADGTARLWQADGTPIAKLESNAGRPLGCLFSTDDRTVLTGHPSGSVRHWFVRTPDLIAAARARCSRKALTAGELRTYGKLLGR